MTETENDKSSYSSLSLIKNQIESKLQNNNYKITVLEPMQNNSELIALVIKPKISWNLKGLVSRDCTSGEDYNSSNYWLVIRLAGPFKTYNPE